MLVNSQQLSIRGVSTLGPGYLEAASSKLWKMRQEPAFRETMVEAARRGTQRSSDGQEHIGHSDARPSPFPKANATVHSRRTSLSPTGVQMCNEARSRRRF